MPEDTLSDFHKWLAKIAWCVNALVRNPAVMECFHEKIWRWYLDVKLRDTAHDVWTRRREEHIDAILATPQLGDKSAGPPLPEWEWWQTARPIHAHDDAGRHDQVVYVAGWTPPELIHNEPKKYWPLPLSKRPLRIEEKYTLLAAIHDKFCHGVEQIRPWPHVLPCDSESARAIADGMTYVVLYHQHVPELLKSEDRHAIEAFLADVEADLRTAAVQPLSSARHSPDFRSVVWGNAGFSFTKMQAAIVGILWGAWKQDTPDVGVDTLLEVVDARSSRLVDAFRNHRAWGTMIVDGETKGSKRLADPPPP